MADLAQLERALRNAHNAGDTEAARRFAKEIKRVQAATQSNEPGGFENFMGFVNRGLVDTALGLGDLVTYPVRAGYEALTGGEMESPSNTVSGILRKLGVSVAEPGVRAETAGERIGEFIGGTAGGLGVLGAARSAAPALGATAQGAISTLTNPYTTRPVASTAQDMAAATGAALGGLGLEQLPEADSEAVAATGRRVGETLFDAVSTAVPGAGLLPRPETTVAGDLGEATARAAQDLPPDVLRLFGELGGGVVGAAAGPAARGALSGATSVIGETPVAGTLLKVGEQFANPMRAQRRRAETVIQGLVEEAPDVVLDRLETDTVLPLTAMQRTREPRLIKAEQDILKRPGNADLDLEYKRQRDQIFQTAEGEVLGMAEGGSPQRASEMIGQWVSTSRQHLETARDETLERAREAVLRAGSPDDDLTALSTRFRDELEDTYRAVKREEDALWSQVPLDIAGDTTNAQRALTEIADNRPVLADLLPPAAKKYLDPESSAFIGDTAPARDLKDLYSVLRAVERQQNAVGGNSQAARLAGTLARAVNDDLNAIADVAPTFNAARAYTRNLHSVFEEGDVAAVLGTSRDGSSRVRPEVALTRLLGGTGPRLVGQANILDDIIGPGTVTGVPNPQAATTAESFMARRFQDAALPDAMMGDVNPRAAERFARGTSEFLDRYPALGDRIRRSVVEVQTESAKAKSIEEQLAALANTPEARFADARTFDEFDTILKTARPAAEMAQLRRTARELGPDAETGLQASATQYILSKLRDKHGGLTATSALDKSSKTSVVDPNVASMLEELFDPDQLRNLNQVLDELSMVDASTAARRGGVTSLQTNSGADTVLSLMAKTGGLLLAKTTTPPGLGTIQGPAVVSGATDYLRRVLTTEAAQEMVERAILQKTPEDAALFRALLSPTPAADLPSQAKSVMESWLRSNGYTQGLDAEDPLEDFRQGLGLPEVNLPNPYKDNPFMPNSGAQR